MNGTMAPRRVTALIAEDEPLLRDRLRHLLGQLWPELEVVAEARNGKEAIEQANQHAPQIAFLDIRMPVMGGVEAARMLCADTRVVFVTAHESYAIEAFDAGAIDYVVKPVVPARLARTVERLKAAVGRQPPDLSEVLRHLGSKLNPLSPTHLQWIRASVGSSLRLVPVEDVLFFTADEKYTRVACAGCELLIRKPIRDLLSELDPVQFLQVNRSTIVNLRRVLQLDRLAVDHLELRVVGSAERIRVARSCAHHFRQM